MKRCGVTRVCVNPQSFNDKTLKLIGRRHTIDDFYQKYEMVKKFGFDVNVDLIAGLPEETVEDFIHSVDCAIALSPENLTVHTLSRKNGSELKNSGKYDNFDIERMIEYSSKVIPQNGYLPYYLYRQKSMLGNLENTGYCKEGRQCINNVTTMEEFLSVDACGAGAISKRVFSAENRIERLANLRDVKLYLEQFDERLQKKRIFYEK
jgi:oxygen-independent coproporphyrinogen-3 oxidase